jgi:protein tyrosine phosphatase (PTP) superfamily phosphohydrolase (DUF442 family)
MAILLAVAGAIVWRNSGVRRVVGREILRSGQPEPEALERAVAKYGVRSLVNLRGESRDEEWYRDEREAARRLGLSAWDVRLRMDESPAQSEVRRLLSALDTAPRPLLLHCRAGADRVGFAAAFARAVRGEALSAALGELQPWAGHLCRRETCRLHGFFADYRRWLSETASGHSAETFRRFVGEAYAPEPYRAEIALDGSPKALVMPGEPVAVRARVRNLSRSVWPLSSGRLGMRLGVRYLGPHPAPIDDALARLRTPGSPEAHDILRAGMEEGAIAPGETREFLLEWEAPRQPGHYVYQIDMVDEFVHWFSDMGGPGVLLRFEVAGAAPVS